MTLGDEGGAAGPESFVDPNADEEDAEAVVTDDVRRVWARAEADTAEEEGTDSSG